MLMNDLILKKRDGLELSETEIKFMIEGYTSNKIPDYQMSAMLMAIYFSGMTGDETLAITMAMVDSGDRIDLSPISGIKADKHSTGGVGDKISLILCPMVAALGIKMAKLSGRGLGHTGGTIDKLESIPGFSCDISMDKFFAQVNDVGFSIASQTANLCPADKKLYALRDVTGTVPSMPLIVSSVMSKKLASGADVIVLDVKAGSGAFMKTEEAAFTMATKMVEVGKLAKKPTVAVISDMDQPLGSSVGNTLEVREVIDVLSGKNAPELLPLCLELGVQILVLCKKSPDEDIARSMLLKTIEDGSALKKFSQFVSAQGGDGNVAYTPEILKKAPVILEVPSPASGYVEAIDAQGVGMAVLHLGGARETKYSVIDHSVGFEILAKKGDNLSKGQPLAMVHANTQERAQEAAKMVTSCYKFSQKEPKPSPLIKGIVK